MNSKSNFEDCAKAFTAYIQNYDLQDEQTALKVRHTWKVVEVMRQLCQKLDLDPRITDLALTTALFHDAGRFEQIRRWHTFLDSKSTDHAALSKEVVLEQNFLKDYGNQDQEMILNAISWHNKLALPDDLDGMQLLLCQLIRDADKVDIFRVFAQETETAAEDSLEKTAHMSISPKVYEDFMADRSINKGDRQNSLDIWISVLAFFYDMNFHQAIELARQQGFYRKHVDQTVFTDPDTALRIGDMLEHLEMYIDRRMEEI